MGKAGRGAKLSPTQIASQLHTENPDAAFMIDRMLRLLSTYSVLTCDEVARADGVGYEKVGLAPFREYFVQEEEGVLVAPLVELIQAKVLIDSWYELRNAVLEGGIPFNRLHGTHAFEYHSRDSRFSEVFNKAMAGPTVIIMKELLNEYNGFEKLNTLVDVGGGLGITLHKIISKYPTINGINFDLPHVIKAAPVYPEVEHIGRDMFASVPGGDAIFMKTILHDWSDDRCIKLLKNCFKVLLDNGKVIVVDLILPVKTDTSCSSKAVCQCDVLLMAHYPGGKERSENEVRALAIAAGFRDLRVGCFVGSVGVIEIYM